MKNLRECLGEMQRKHRETLAKLEEEKKLKVDRLNTMKVSPAAVEGTSDTVKELHYWNFSAGLFRDKQNKTMAVCD